MGLSSELISQFAKITNDNKTKTSEEVTLYGEVRKDGDDVYVQFDGSEQWTPVTTRVETNEDGTTKYTYGAASVKTGDRVSVSLSNHSAVITGNISDPPVGRAEFTVGETDIIAKIDNVALILNGLDESITARVAQTEVKIDEFGVTFKGLGDGTTVINGGCIQTGTIKAEYLELTGAISFADLSDSEDIQGQIDSAKNDAATAKSTANTAKSTANTAKNTADSALSKANSITIPDYIKSSYISKVEIRSPTFKGNNIQVYDTFQTIGYDGVSNVVTGYMGAASGKDSYGNSTLGVALSNTWDYDDRQIGNSYVIVTNAGVRLQFGANNLVVSSGGIYLNAEASGAKAYYNGVEIGGGSGTGTPVWG